MPLEIEGTDETGETRMLNVFDDLVNEDGEMQLIVKCLDRSQYLGMTKSGVYLRPAENTFPWNLCKAYISIWLQMTMVIAFGVMFSTFLSGPVAMVATFVCVLLGFSAEQIYDTRHYIDEGIADGWRTGGVARPIAQARRDDHAAGRRGTRGQSHQNGRRCASFTAWMRSQRRCPTCRKWSARPSTRPVDSISSVPCLARHATATLGYCILAFLISYFFLKSREIAA